MTHPRPQRTPRERPFDSSHARLAAKLATERCGAVERVDRERADGDVRGTAEH